MAHASSTVSRGRQLVGPEHAEEVWMLMVSPAPRRVRRARRVLDDDQADRRGRHRGADHRHGGRGHAGVAGRGVSDLRHGVRDPRPQHTADPDRVLLRLRLLHHLAIPARGSELPHRRDNNFRWAVLALAVYHAAFVAEALRSGINTVPKGQAEAARAIGLAFRRP